MEQIHETVLPKHGATDSTGLQSLREYIRGVLQSSQLSTCGHSLAEFQGWRRKFGKVDMAGSCRTYF